jgi:hypothetical protein
MVAVHDGGHGSFAVDEDTDLALLVSHLLTSSADKLGPAFAQDEHADEADDE